jgi:phage-related minor tail protein
LATIKELKAKFSATADGFRREVRNIRESFTQMGTTTERAMDDSNEAVRRFKRALEDLERAIANSDNPQMFQALSQAIQNSQQELSQTGTIAETSMQEVQDAISDAHQEFTQLGDASSDALQEVENAINAVEQELNHLGDAGSDSLHEVEDAVNDVEAEIDQLAQNGSNELDHLGDSINDVGSDTEELEGSAQEAEGGFVGAFGGIKGAVLGVVAAIGAAILAVWQFISAGDELKKAMNHLEVNTNATREEIKEMETSLINIYKNNYGESFYDIADAMAQVRRVTGLTGEALEDATTKAILLRDSFGFEVNESLKVTNVMMKQFGISADEAFTLFAQGQRDGLNYADDMMDSFWEYAVYFKQLGFDAEGMWNIFKAGADGGAFNLDKVGDSIKELGIRVKDGSEASAEAFQALGLNAKKTSKEFAAGGESAQTALAKVFKGLGEIEDPIKRNAIGVALFGTQFEDLEANTILSLGNVRTQADMTADTLEKIDEIKYNSIGEAFVGIWRMISGELLIPLQQKAMPGINHFVETAKGLLTGFIDMMRGDIPSNLFDAISKGFGKDKHRAIQNFFIGIRDGITQAKETMAPFKQFVEGVFALFDGNFMKGSDILTKLGLSAAQVQLVANAINLIKNFVSTLWQIVSAAFEGIRAAVTRVIGFLAPYILPLILQIVTFIGEKLKMITGFWNQYGGQIMQAVQNAFNFILGIIQFIMPAVLFIINSVWTSIKGVIDGALKIIMGLVKIFTGLFTGDWSLLWEGVKQLLGGALQFLWNLFSLMMIGKLLGGIKAFILGGINFFKSFGTSVVGTFKSFFNNIITWFNFFRQTGSSIWSAMIKTLRSTIQIFVDAVKVNFNNILNSATTVFNGVKNAIMHPIQTARDVVKGIVGEIKGFFTNMKLSLPNIKMPHFKIKNWSKNPLDWLKAMPSLDIDWYADGAIFTKPTLFNTPAGMKGFGEAGPEAAIPLTDTVLGKIGSMIAATMPQSSGQGDIFIEVPLYLDNREVARGTYKYTTEFQEHEENRFK